MKKTKTDIHLMGKEARKNLREDEDVFHSAKASSSSQAQAALHESESHFRLLFNSSNDAVFVFGYHADGRAGKFIDVNDAACERLGYSRAELLKLTPADINAPERAAQLPGLMKLLSAEKNHVFEWEQVARSGRRIPVEINARLFELKGQPAVLCIVRDISARKRAEEMARLAREQLEGIFANIHAMIALLDADLNFVCVNNAYAEADGHEPAFFIGKNHFDLYPDAENEVIFRKVMKTGQPYLAYAKPFRYPDHPERGTSYWDWALSPVKGEDGKATGLILSLVNVTERRLAELAREESERNISALFEATPESVLLLDLDGKVLALNETAARRLKKSRPELLGQNVFDFIPPAVAEERRRWLDEVIRSGKMVRFDDMRKGVRFEHTIYPVFNAAGKVARFATYSVDVTELRQSEAIEKLLSEFNQRVMQGQELSDVLEFVCAEIAQRFDLQLAYIAEKKQDGSLHIVACAGEAIEFEKTLTQVGIRWDNSAQGKGSSGTAIRTGKVQVFKISQPGFKLWRSAAEQFHLQSIMAIPLILRGEIYGVFNLYSQDAETFDHPAMAQRLSAIASRICVALEMAMDQQQLRLLGSALETTSNAVFITGLDGRIQWVNAAFTHLTGYGEMEAVGQTPRILKSGKQDEEYYRVLWETIRGGESWSRETVERRKDGGLFTVQQTVTPIFDESGGISHFISILEDISVRKLTEERIRHMAEYDALTELPNRALFYDRLQQAMLASKRKRDRLALLYLDLDRFKAVNDSLGHHVGDLLLQAAAQRLQECLRESDTVARLGGDEFTVILHEIGGTEDVALVAEKIIAALTAPFHLTGHEVTIGTSIGIVLYAGGAETDPDQFVKRADGAMYLAKKRGGNTFEFAPD
jgi:diguanylate cyclase (GGDEF)-like protein/PAS domain S-box-containing protein